MTTKLNLTPLIERFSEINPEIATRLARICEVPKASNTTNDVFRKIASTLVEIADQLDTTDPDLAAEADGILQELTKNAQALEHSSHEGFDVSSMGGSGGSDDPKLSHSLHLPDFDEMDEAEDDSTDSDPEIEEPSEPETEYDEISLDDLDGRIKGMNWRLTDRPMRERYQKALEHARRAKQYLDAHNKYKDVAHSIFDDGGDKLRFKFD